jgi:DNA-binding transcriptional LysR family regulator
VIGRSGCFQQPLLNATVKRRCTIARKLAPVYDVRRLRLLRELAARGTVTAVADALAYTPSAVSQGLAHLERDTGMVLLERVGRGVRLTEAGRRLAEHADAVIGRLEAAEADLAGLAGETGGPLRVACFQTAAVTLVVPALVALEAEHPGLVGEIADREAEVSLPALRLGDHDVVVVEEYEHAPRRLDAALERSELGRDRILVAVPQAHPAAERDAVALSELAGEPWVTAREDSAFGAMLVRACRSLGGFEPVIRHRTNDLRLLSELVARLGAVSLVPSLGRDWMVPGVVLRPIAGPPLDRRIVAVERTTTRDRPAIGALREALAARAVVLGLK